MENWRFQSYKIMKCNSIKSENSAGKIIAITMLFSLAYVVTRYHIFGGVPWKDFPFYILNKALALGGFILITYNFSFGPLKNFGIKVPDSWLNARNILSMTGFLLVLIHALMSFILFRPEIYGKFFEKDGTLTLMAGISILGGILSFVILWMMNLTFQSYMREDKAFVDFITSRTFLLWAFTLGGVHLFFMGYSGWLHPSLWHAGIPPVSLVAMLFFIVGYTVNILGRK